MSTLDKLRRAAAMHLGKGNAETALRLAQSVLAQGDDGECRSLLATALLRLGRTDEAIS